MKDHRRPNIFLSGMLVLLAVNFAPFEQPDHLDKANLIESEWLAVEPCTSPFVNDKDWLLTADSQFAAAIKSSDDVVRSNALRDIIFAVTQCSDLIPWTESSDALLNVYGFERDDTHRVMAIAALFAIGDEEAMQRLRVLSEQVVQSEWVLQHTKRALYVYYKNREQ